MARLRHRTAASCVYFVTTKAWGNRNIFQVGETAEIVIEVLLRYRADDFYLLHEFVLRPDHLHILLTPAGTTTLEKAIQLIKGASSYEIHKRRSNAMQIWQPGFREWTIRDREDFRVKAHYIQNNPIAAKLVRVANEWLYGSAGGRFRLDPPPATFPAFTSGAKAPGSQAGVMSELKLRPPELKLRTPELKLQTPASPASPASVSGGDGSSLDRSRRSPSSASPAKALGSQAGVMSELKLRPPELKFRALELKLQRPAASASDWDRR